MGVRYPFNMTLFKVFSDFFDLNQNLIQQNGDINLNSIINQDESISKDFISDFIKFIANQKISITKENLQTLFVLAKKFNIKKLLDLITDFISKNPTDYVIHFLKMDTNQLILNPEKYEDIIAANLLSYIKNDDLLNLPITILHRIIKKYLSNPKEEIKIAELFPFLFKCLDKFERKASVLFENGQKLFKIT